MLKALFLLSFVLCTISLKVDETNQIQHLQNQPQLNKTEVVKQVGLGALISSGTTALANFASSALMTFAGWTTSGVSAGSLAAGIQSGLGSVQAGSAFSYLQATAALGEGILGAQAIPIIIGVGLVVGSFILISKFTHN